MLSCEIYKDVEVCSSDLELVAAAVVHSEVVGVELCEASQRLWSRLIVTSQGHRDSGIFPASVQETLESREF